MSNLSQRVISAVVALILILSTAYFYGPVGVCLLSTLVCVIAILEYEKLSFSSLSPPLSFRILFLATAISLLVYTVWRDDLLLSVWGLIISSFIFLSLIFLKNTEGQEDLLNLINRSVLGFLYIALLPSLGLKLLLAEGGLSWFFLMLGIVFMGDISAYFGGKFFGVKKLMPNLSPSKTQVGALAGLLGSSLIAGIFYFYYLSPPPLFMLIVGLFGGAIAQSGDLFESLLKRVAKVKDSGKIMPGHGGILDRLDGVYFASPVIYAAYEISKLIWGI